MTTTHTPEQVRAAQAALSSLITYWEALHELEVELGFDLDEGLDQFASGLGTLPITEPEAISCLDWLKEAK